jgi:hypothetical protein
MTGGNKVRYCGQCRLNVYNLAVMGRVDAVLKKHGPAVRPLVYEAINGHPAGLPEGSGEGSVE